eukprot:940160-Amphidinium_carterae.1
MDLPPTDPADKQLAQFWGRNAIKLLNTGRLIENEEIAKRPEYRTDHGKKNSFQRYQDEKMCWGDRSIDGDWADPDPYDRRNR